MLSWIIGITITALPLSVMHDRPVPVVSRQSQSQKGNIMHASCCCCCCCKCFIHSSNYTHIRTPRCRFEQVLYFEVLVGRLMLISLFACIPHAACRTINHTVVSRICLQLITRNDQKFQTSAENSAATWRIQRTGSVRSRN